MNKKKTVARIPEFKSYKEEAEFWDTHDFTDFADELKPVNVRFAKNLSHALSIRLDTRTLDELRQQAARKGIGPTTLARMWIMEHLETAAQPARPRRTVGPSRQRTRRAS